MSASEQPERPAAQRPATVARVLRRLFGKHGTVTAVDSIGAQFRLVTVTGPELAGVAWSPGQKVQVAMPSSSFAARTYTPIDWDAETGQTRLLGYAHGDGPGSRWLRDIALGDECDFFGPSGSLDARRLRGQLAVFGDETSIGLADALARQDRRRPVHCYLEVVDLGSAERVIEKLGIENVTFFSKQPGDAHLEGMEAALPSLNALGSSFVLTGKASTIQRLRRSLKLHAVPTARLATKAYWAPGKTGLD
ncbi:MAG: siderophore-interacting protein [Polyangiaceae bacterium]